MSFNRSKGFRKIGKENPKWGTVEGGKKEITESKDLKKWAYLESPSQKLNIL